LIEKLHTFIENGDVLSIKKLMEDENLIIKDGKLIANDMEAIKDKEKYWDQIQLIKKIQLNSIYGSLTNIGSLFFDQRLGQSCTLSGRCTTRHMGSKINEYIMGTYDLGASCVAGDTDSVVGDSTINTDIGTTTIENLFLKGSIFWSNGDKEYSVNDRIKIQHYKQDGSLGYVDYNYVYRHKVSKRKFKIKTMDGKFVIVTEDHSVMILENGNLVEKKPLELKKGDKVITTTNKSEIEEIEDLGYFDDEYVYDLGVKDADPYFFANDILVHNSIYFTVANPDDYDKESFVKFSDKIASDVNATFSDYFNATFNVPLQNTKVIKCGREICATAALFIKKKRYTALVYDEKGYRYDTKGKEGKLKIMGLDIKRADCPAWVQQKLEDTIFQLLAKEYSEAEILEYIRAWREEFASFDPWKMGTPKRVNKLTYYTGVFRNKTKGITVPGHVRASINWNDMLNFHNDRNSMTIMDGQKVIVCKLLKNKFNIDSIAYPIDQHFLPDWFKVMPFDTNLMVTTAVDQRIENIFGMLDWNLEQSKETETFRENFSWE
jgi:hypothetical protein